MAKVKKKKQQGKKRKGSCIDSDRVRPLTFHKYRPIYKLCSCRSSRLTDMFCPSATSTAKDPVALLIHTETLYSLGAHYGDVYCNESKDVKTQELELLTSSFQKNSRPRCAISFYNKPILGAMGSRGHRSIYRCR